MAITFFVIFPEFKRNHFDKEPVLYIILRPLSSYHNRVLTLTLTSYIMPKECVPNQLHCSTRLATHTRPTISSMALGIKHHYREFQRRIRIGELITFNQQQEQWEEWTPYALHIISILISPLTWLCFSPVVITSSGAMGIASPPIYPHIPGYIPPLCAHILDTSLTQKDCSMVFHTFRQCQNTQCYTLKAPHNDCQFICNPFCWKYNHLH